MKNVFVDCYTGSASHLNRRWVEKCTVEAATRTDRGMGLPFEDALLITLSAGQRSAGGTRFNIVYQRRVDKYPILVMLPLPLSISGGQEELLLVNAVLKCTVAVIAIMQNSRGDLPDVPSRIHKHRRI
jgi:hypothetical protein